MQGMVEGGASCILVTGMEGAVGGKGEHLLGRLLGSLTRHRSPSPCALSARQKQWLEGKGVVDGMLVKMKQYSTLWPPSVGQ